MKVKVYGDGPYKDEGGSYRLEVKAIPSWVTQARRICAGCHDDFYNYRANCTGNSWCFSLKPSFAKRKTRPPCYH